ncbi:hypothetical protein, partial [Treponema sp.]|uniref:hypothetical protein n=1 Tax=Treponema sp. TaxID=166 RepID=UPI003890EC94
MIKICFSAFVIAVVFLIGVVFKKIGKNPTPISRSIQKVLIPASFSLLSHICTTFAPTPFFASVFFTVYFISVSWLAVFLTEFCQRFTQVKRFSTLFYKFIYYFTVLVTVLFIFNIHNNIIFSINPVIFASYGFFVIKPTSLFYVHMAIGLSFYIYCVTIVLIKTVKSVSFLRARYYSVLLMLFLMLSSAVLKGGADLPIDFSVFLYCIVVPVCYYITFILVPRRIVRKSLGFVVDTLKSGIVFCDDDWKCLYVNSHFSDFFNCTAENALSIEPVSNFLELKKSIAVEKNDTFIEEFDYEK